MPNASVLEKKQQQVAELAEKISGAVMLRPQAM